ncbi:RNA polymerase sigma factor SigZ [Rhodobacteraceae bacterium RKSG542]|uniref:RNA polymerase sigma factor SigZ n=1 Tax=Pseudovibrio flavus TaxID=2529854 RepID=UPI0012BD07F2|nr:RNA polymerase sigma factor SigZ [Pseudovibrio flavus]MTI18301.1 RNA polymerase sigma factor SigZ [Pseudovibrio flavus]
MPPFEQIWQDYQGALRSYLRGRLKNQSDVDDLLQDIMIKVHKGLPELQEAQSLPAWLKQITRNTLIDYYRKSVPETELPEDLSPDLEEAGALEDLERCVEPFLKALPEETAALLRDVELNGQSQKDYASAHGVAYSTVKSRVQKGREQLRHLFDQCCQFEQSANGQVTDFSRKSKNCDSC